MRKTVPVWMVMVLAVVSAVTWAGITNKAAVFDGIVESTIGGFMFPDQSVQTTAMVDTTCDGQPCDGTYFTNVNSAALSGSRLVDSLSQTMGPLFGAGVGDDATFPTLLTLGEPGELVRITVTRNTYMLRGSGGTLGFTGPNCTGDVYFQPGDPNNTNFQHWTQAMYVMGNYGVLYRATDPGFTTSFTAASKVRPQDSLDWVVGDLADKCRNNPEDLEGYPAEPFADLAALPFVPDFRPE